MTIRSIAPVFICLSFSTAHAVDLASDIESVTVYPGGASVTRVAAVELSVGTNEIRLTGLVHDIDVNELQVMLSNGNVHMGQVRLAREQQRAAFNAEIEKLRVEIDVLAQRMKEFDDSSNAARLRLKFLEGLAEGYAKEAWNEATRGTANVSSWQAALDLLQSGADDANKLIRDNGVHKAELGKDLSVLNRHLAELRGGSLSTSAIELSLSASSATRTDIRLTYFQPSAGWAPRYEARLDSNSGSLQLSQQADVYQETDENWANVQMVLSTSAPSGELAAPELNSQFLDLAAPRPPEKLARTQQASAPMAADMMLEQVVVTGNRPAVRANIGNFAVTYDIPGRVSVPNTADDAIVVDLVAQSFNTELLTQVVPRKADQAFLAARLLYDDARPLYSGQMAVYVDGVFAGNTAMPGAQPGETVVLPMGQDRRIDVKVENQGGQGGTSGVIGKRKTEATDYLFEISNRRDAPSYVEVSDLYPVSRNRDIEVEVPRSATPPDERDIEDKPGVVVWRKTLVPGETWRIRHQYTVSYPAKMVLQKN